MKRFLLMLVICVSSFMIYTNNVKADSCSYSYNSGWGGIYNQNRTLNNGFNYYDVNLSNDISFSSDYDYVKFPLYWVLTSSTGYLSNINLDLVCSSTYTTNTSYEITYGDGTHAYIDSEYAFGTYCNEYKSSLNNLGTAIYTYQPNLGVVSIGVKTQVDNQEIYNYCNVDVNGLVTCYRPKGTNVTMKGVRFNFTSNQGSSTISFGALTGWASFCKSDSNTITSNTTEIKNEIKNDNVSGAEGSADDLKNNSAFQDNSGLSGVISMPLTFVNSLTNTCQPINLNIPYMDVNVTIPCMQSIITNKMPLLANLIKIVINGFIVYRILLDIFQIVRNAKNPEDDRIEVLDL